MNLRAKRQDRRTSWMARWIEPRKPRSVIFKMLSVSSQAFREQGNAFLAENASNEIFRKLIVSS